MAILTTPQAPISWRPDVVDYPHDEVVPEALISQTSNVLAGIEGDAPAVRVPWVRDVANVGFVAEGELIPDAELTTAETVITTRKVAAIDYFSAEVMRQEGASKRIADALSGAVTNSANIAYLSNASNPAGLTTLATAGGAVADNIDPLTDAVAAIEGHGGQASHVVASPKAWASLSKLKAGAGSAQPLLGAGVEAGERRVLGLPVFVTPALDEGVLVLDSRTVLAAVGPVQVAVSEHLAFDRDVVAVRVVWRLGWQLQHPERVIALTVTGEDG